MLFLSGLSAAGGEVQRPRIVKHGTLDLDLVETTPVVFKDRLYRFEYVRRRYKLNLTGDSYFRLIDVQTGKPTPGFAKGFHLGSAFVDGDTIYERIDGGRPMAESKAVPIVLQCATALAHAHNQGLIHRDVKPKNIMMTKDGQAKLADMGLAREVSDAVVAQAEAGRAYGTPYYISPEQIRGEVDIDFRADIYSLGATLYHLVTGQVPFEAPTPAAVMHKHLKTPLVPPDHINTSLSGGLGEVVEVMMAKDRRRRYASTSDLLMDLEAIGAGEPPLLARRQIDAGVLSGLAEEEENSAAAEEVPVSDMTGGALILVIVLAAALAVSVIVNIVQALNQ